MMLERVGACVKAHAPLPFQPRKKRVAAGDRCQQLGAVGMDEHPVSAMVEQAPPLPQGGAGSEVPTCPRAQRPPAAMRGGKDDRGRGIREIRGEVFSGVSSFHSLLPRLRDHAVSSNRSRSRTNFTIFRIVLKLSTSMSSSPTLILNSFSRKTSSSTNAMESSTPVSYRSASREGTSTFSFSPNRAAIRPCNSANAATSDFPVLGVEQVKP